MITKLVGVAVELWISNQEMLSFNLDHDPCSLGKFFCGFPQSYLASSGVVPQLGYDCFLPNSFQFIIHQLSWNLMLYSYNLETDSVIKYKTKKLNDTP
jgi:hypothetical protein